jgi:hypothetical protein
MQYLTDQVSKSFSSFLLSVLNILSKPCKKLCIIPKCRLKINLMRDVWRACNLTWFSPCLTGPVDYLFASRHKGLRFKSPGEDFCETEILLLAMSRYRCTLCAYFWSASTYAMRIANIFSCTHLIVIIRRLQYIHIRCKINHIYYCMYIYKQKAFLEKTVGTGYK